LRSFQLTSLATQSATHRIWWPSNSAAFPAFCDIPSSAGGQICRTNSSRRHAYRSSTSLCDVYQNAKPVSSSSLTASELAKKLSGCKIVRRSHLPLNLNGGGDDGRSHCDCECGLDHLVCRQIRNALSPLHAASCQSARRGLSGQIRHYMLAIRLLNVYHAVYWSAISLLRYARQIEFVRHLGRAMSSIRRIPLESY
jgi:hypothetical protein